MLPINPRSITARLITAVLAVELLSSILVVFLSFGYERHSHFRAFDIVLHGRADSILGAVQDAEDANDSLILDPSALWWKAPRPITELARPRLCSSRRTARRHSWRTPPRIPW